MNHSGALSQGDPSGTSQDDHMDATASFAHSLSVAPLDSASTIHSISLALNGSSYTNGGEGQHHQHHDADVLMMDATTPTITTATSASSVSTSAFHFQQPESRMAVAELLVSLGQSSRSVEQHIQNGHQPSTDSGAGSSQQTLTYRAAADYVGLVKKAYEGNPRVYTEFLSALEKYHELRYMFTSLANNHRSAGRTHRDTLDMTDHSRNIGAVAQEFNCEIGHSDFNDIRHIPKARIVDRLLRLFCSLSMTIEQLVRTVMALFQDQPDLLMGFKEFLPEAQGLLNQLVPPMMYSDYKVKVKAETQPTIPAGLLPTTVGVEQTDQPMDVSANNNGHAAADFLSLIKERSQQEPDMYQHLITLLRKFQKDHSYSTLYFYVSIILRYHPHLLQRFHKFLPTVASGIEVTEPRVISKAPPEELVVSPDFIEAKDFVQTVKYEAKNDMSMYDRFIFALEKYQCTGWTIDQVYSEVSLIFWNHPEALAGFKQFITTVPQQP
ncbi:hypothetical protein KI688_004826 [Linnemannia hyalina]|uniref:Uncharacterized protein n=1 Tax=Linnemannia hyalina TaxID=64524 RepID=A0A9P8BRS3_9FUNG|nr:hypothetical protein KI688_004826 [Linnemannia hyalina]